MTMEHIRETLGQKFMSHKWNQPEMLAPFIPVNYPNMLTVQGREIQVIISFENYTPKKENLLPEKNLYIDTTPISAKVDS